MRFTLRRSHSTAGRVRRPLASLAVLAVSLAGGAAHAADEPKNVDPLEKVNRATYAFNDALDRMFARPLAKTYRKVVPEPARNAVSNVVANLEYPTTALNSALQGKFRNAGSDTLRFLVNSTIGIGGIADPATKFGLPANDEDFGQTLGHWGVPTGPYLVLPFLGPSNMRDAPARVADRYTNARYYIGDGSTEFYLLGVDVIDQRASLLAAEGALQRAYDPYALVRDAYLQRREYLVRDGDVPEPSYEDEMLEEPIPVDAPPEGAEPTATPPSDAPTSSDTAAPTDVPTAPTDAPASSAAPTSEVPADTPPPPSSSAAR